MDVKDYIAVYLFIAKLMAAQKRWFCACIRHASPHRLLQTDFCVLEKVRSQILKSAACLFCLWQLVYIFSN